MPAPWGYHLTLDCRACEIPSITNRAHVAQFARELVAAIEMKAYGDPQVVHFGTGNKAGFTLVQLIETSNICAHFCNDTGDCYLDVFSCKPFDPAVVQAVVARFFSPAGMKANFLNRQA